MPRSLSCCSSPWAPRSPRSATAHSTRCAALCGASAERADVHVVALARCAVQVGLLWAILATVCGAMRLIILEMVVKDHAYPPLLALLYETPLAFVLLTPVLFMAEWDRLWHGRHLQPENVCPRARARGAGWIVADGCRVLRSSSRCCDWAAPRCCPSASTSSPSWPWPTPARSRCAWSASSS